MLVVVHNNGNGLGTLVVAGRCKQRTRAWAPCHSAAAATSFCLASSSNRCWDELLSPHHPIPCWSLSRVLPHLAAQRRLLTAWDGCCYQAQQIPAGGGPSGQSLTQWFAAADCWAGPVMCSLPSPDTHSHQPAREARILHGGGMTCTACISRYC
jgi:hypothetical protein